MHCQLCRKKIGLLRRVFDPQYCCSGHRKKARKASARLVREYDPGLYYEDPWPSFSPENEKKKPNKMGMPGMVICTCLVLTLCAALVIGPAPSGGGPGSAVETAGGTLPASGGPTPPQSSGGFGSGLRRLLPERESVRVSEDFTGEFKNWTGSLDHWTTKSGYAHPGGLLLLKPSLGLSDYQLDFEGQVEKKGLNWAYRAANTQNYYATKISFGRTGSLPGADLVRFAVIGGKEQPRSSYPLPLLLRKDQMFHVAVNIKGSDFVTSINGQIVDTWTDARLKSGGVGFFSERGESSAIHWVHISQKRSIIDGFFAAAIPFSVYADLL